MARTRRLKINISASQSGDSSYSSETLASREITLPLDADSEKIGKLIARTVVEMRETIVDFHGPVGELVEATTDLPF